MWKYTSDTDAPMCECSECKGRLTLRGYWPSQIINPFIFCPYCGERMALVRVEWKAGVDYNPHDIEHTFGGTI